MNFTREPLIETVISSKDGHKLALRNSKGGGQEEFFVDAVEVITFGNNCFYRSLEKPKSFLVPVNDYEILEVRETRMVLKTAAVERVKIGGGRESAAKQPREEKEVPASVERAEAEVSEEQKVDKRRERRRTRKRRGKDEEAEQKEEETPAPAPRLGESPSLIPPPSTLISDTIKRYKEVAEVKTEEEPSANEKEISEETEEETSKKKMEFSEEPSEDSSEAKEEAHQQVENDEEIPF